MKWALETIPGTDILIPSTDNGATLHIRQKKKLNWDDAFAAIPEIKALKPWQVVFDIGAWIGDTTAEFLSHGCTVHSFEPRPDLFVCLLNNCPKANCYNLAVGSGKPHGVSRLGGNTGAYPLTEGDKFSVTLDSLKVNQIEFLKIDVEGYEGEVLRGAKETLSLFKPIIHIEFNPSALAKFGVTPEDIISWLKGLGYHNWRETYRHVGPHGPHWDCIVKRK